jgi:hypothetical protein
VPARTSGSGVRRRIRSTLLHRRSGRAERAPDERGAPRIDGSSPARRGAVVRTLEEVEVLDARNLVCTHLGRRTTLLHYSWTPKAWERRAWPRIRRDAYVQLLRRVLFASDVTVRLDPAEFPLWLKPGTAGNLSLHTLTTANRAARTVLYGMPPQIRGRLLSLYNQFLTRP